MEDFPLPSGLRVSAQFRYQVSSLDCCDGICGITHGKLIDPGLVEFLTSVAPALESRHD